jgi:hypothetical protein
MDWNLEQTKQQKMWDRVLDLLEERFHGRPISRSVAKAHAVDLHEGLQVRKCIERQPVPPISQKPGNQFRRSTNGRSKWFDAR